MNSQKQGLIYASGGVGKTNFLDTMAKYYWKRDKQKTRVVTADGGGIGPLEVGIQIGAIEALDISSWPSPFRTFDMISKGFWPKNVASKEPWKEMQATGDFKAAGIAAYGVEGLTAFGDVLMRYTRDRRAKGEQIGQMDGKGLGLFKDGDKDNGGEVSLGVNAMSDYSIAQSYLRTYVHNFRQLWSKGLEFILWTALELKATDDAKVPVYGPMLPGKATTAACIPWFTDVLHLDIIDPKKQPDGSNSGTRRLFLNQHYANNDPVPFLAKNSAHKDGKMPNVIEPDFSVFMAELEKANKKALEGWQ